MRYLLVLLFVPAFVLADDRIVREYEADKYRERQEMYMQDIARSESRQAQAMENLAEAQVVRDRTAIDLALADLAQKAGNEKNKAKQSQMIQELHRLIDLRP
jgi:hypothetical protein